MTLAVLTASEMKDVESWTQQECGLTESQMIAQAGQVIFNTARSLHSSYACPSRKPWIFICGKGHNGADGLQCALLAMAEKYRVKVFQIYAAKGYSPETKLLQDQFKKLNKKIHIIKNEKDFIIPEDAALIIDGLLGAGITREADSLIAHCIHKINNSFVPTLSIDIPSGMYTDSSHVHLWVNPLATICLGTPKISSQFHPTRKAYGRIYFDTLCFPQKKLHAQTSPLKLFRREDAIEIYPLRPYDAHKYRVGKVLVIAGSLGMHGAAIMTAQSALKAGAGLVKLAVPGGIRGEVCRHTLEVITIPVGSALHKVSAVSENGGNQHIGCFTSSHCQELSESIEWADAVVLGPGLGKNKETVKFLCKLIPQINKPLVVDGDGLQFFNPELSTAYKKTKTAFPNIICTPHGGEFKRMGGVNQYDQPLEHINNIRSLAVQLKTNVLWKGPTSLFASDKGTCTMLPSGSPGLATAGTGDVLAGILGAFMCLLNHKNAVGLAAYIHSTTANFAGRKTGMLSMTASDVIAHIHLAMKELESEKIN